MADNIDCENRKVGSVIIPQSNHLKELKKRKTAPAESDEQMDSSEQQEISLAAPADESLCPVDYRPGDLLWGRIGLAPYWPCCVTPDPDLHIWTMAQKGKGGNADKYTRQYHVQFFGRVSRAWISHNGLLQYKGLEEFQERGAKVKNDKKKKDKKLLKAFFPKSKTKTLWDEAAKEIQDTEGMDHSVRLEHMRRLLKELPVYNAAPKQQTSQQKQKNSGHSSSSGRVIVAFLTFFAHTKFLCFSSCSFTIMVSS